MRMPSDDSWQLSIESVETMLQQTLTHASSGVCPPRFAKALHWAVFPGGARIRPKLCLAVAAACAEPDARLFREPKPAIAAAAALEILHCASLVHDDLPCFDNAATRRGVASVHAEFGQRLAVLVGDALIVHGFEIFARELVDDPVAGRLAIALASGVGGHGGISAGQAWECEPNIDLPVYQRAKTGALFATATCSGALAAGHTESDGWSELGNQIGEAFQVADDILDAAGSQQDTGKPVGQDALLARPNAVASYGLEGAAQKLRQMVEELMSSVPPCPGQSELQKRIKAETEKLLPAHLATLAA